ncbi:14592_t:CDS:2 [Dentiscutata heterogama]|uniref:14592_t:CDS:1 n=1 Tax=Dentiscutata heterogama TaxID=1316150 RepID=A0ACA9JYU4_9GLOM|nr:14592_t:CDS:2 [Dentiscutata heterogama]
MTIFLQETLRADPILSNSILLKSQQNKVQDQSMSNKLKSKCLNYGESQNATTTISLQEILRTDPILPRQHISEKPTNQDTKKFNVFGFSILKILLNIF